MAVCTAKYNAQGNVNRSNLIKIVAATNMLAMIANTLMIIRLRRSLKTSPLLDSIIFLFCLKSCSLAVMAVLMPPKTTKIPTIMTTMVTNLDVSSDGLLYPKPEWSAKSVSRL